MKIKLSDLQLNGTVNTIRAEQTERILARKVARELSSDEIAEIAGGRMAAGVSRSGPCCEEDDCCAF